MKKHCWNEDDCKHEVSAKVRQAIKNGTIREVDPKGLSTNDKILAWMWCAVMGVLMIAAGLKWVVG